MKSPVVLITAILIAVEVVIGSPLLAEVIGVKNAALVSLVFVALQAGFAAWMRSQVTPVANPKDGQGRTLVPVNGSAHNP